MELTVGQITEVQRSKQQVLYGANEPAICVMVRHKDLRDSSTYFDGGPVLRFNTSGEKKGKKKEELYFPTCLMSE